MNITETTVVFDLETTSAKYDARIIEIAVLKIWPDGTGENFKWAVNPEAPIEPGATETHGYTDEMVKTFPTFRQVAVQIYNAISDASTIITYNGTGFDIPILHRQLTESGLTWNPLKLKHIDVCRLVKKLHPRTLAAMYAMYTGVELDGAHSANVDTVATFVLLQKVVEKHPEIGDNASEVLKWVSDGEQERFLDVAGIFKQDSNNNIIFVKGKHADEVVDLDKHKSYLQWMTTASKPPFAPDTLSIVSKLLTNQI